MAIGLVAADLSKSVFQLSLADANHHIVSRKRLNRTQFHRFLAQSGPVRLIMEACATAHYWGRTAQLLGQEVKLLHAKYAKVYVRRTKTDAADADALSVPYSVQQIRGDITAVFGQLLKHGLVQPHIHLRRITHLVGGATKLCRQLLARPKAAIKTKQLHQIDDGYLPV